MLRRTIIAEQQADAQDSTVQNTPKIGDTPSTMVSTCHNFWRQVEQLNTFNFCRHAGFDLSPKSATCRRSMRQCDSSQRVVARVAARVSLECRARFTVVL